MNTNYERLKLYVTSRAQNTIWANELGSCTDIDEFIKYIKIHFLSFCKERFITEWVINEFEDIFNEYHIFCNKNTTQGYLLVTKGRCNATSETNLVVALDKSEVNIFNKVTCFAFDRAHITASDRSTVYANDKARVLSFDNSITYCSDETIVYSTGFSSIFAKGNSHIEARGCSNVRATENVKITASGGSVIRSLGAKAENIRLFKDAVMIDYNTKIIRSYDKEVDL